MEMIRLSKLEVDEEQKSYEVIGTACICKNTIQSFCEYHPKCSIVNFVNMEDFFKLEDEGKIEDGSFPTEITLESGEKVIVAEMTDYIKKICDGFITLTLDKRIHGTTENDTEIQITVNPAHLLALTKWRAHRYSIISTTSSEKLYVLEDAEAIAKMIP